MTASSDDKVSPEKWQQVRDLFDAALTRPAEERAKFLDRACSGDEALRREVESLLASDEEAESFMEVPAVAGAAKSLLGDDQTKLEVGAQLGHYQIVSAIGEGGMGEVYLAHDTSLGREIALKLLPVDFASDQNRVRRFQQEARAASALNHPNVCVVYEIGKTDDGRHYMAMEHVAGVTLRQQIASHPLKLSQALDAATQIAAALVAAHGAGIVHRDIKPENVMVRNDALIKVLDFGLAKRSADPIVGDSQAHTNLLVNTAPGVVMGTVAYMSPEQARGLEIDARTDIWSLGVVLYEMVTNKVPFAGATSSDLIVSILDREPLPLSRHLPDLPAELQRIVSKALRKDKEERYQVVKDMFLDLKILKQELEFKARLQHSTPPEAGSDEIGSREVIGETAHQAAHNVGRQTKEVQTAHTTLSAEFRKPLLWAVGVMVGVLLIAVGAWYLAHMITKRRLTPPALTAIPLTTDPGIEGMPSLSPDGNQVAFASGGPQTDNFDIYVKQIGGGPPRRLTSDPAVDEFPAWSPDGRSIAFIRDRGDKLEVLLIPSLGGPERKIADTVVDRSIFIFSRDPPYLSWSADNKYLVTTDRASPGEPPSLFVLSVGTGEKRRLTTPPATALSDGNPAVSPDGRTLAFVRIISDGNPQLYVLPLSEDYQAAGEERHLDLSQPSVLSPAWTANGQEIVCFAGQRWGEGRLWRVPLSGSEKPQPLSSVGPVDVQPTISRQGNRLVYAHWTADEDIWRVEVSGRARFSPPVKLIASTRVDTAPEYSPDRSRIVFTSDRSSHNEIWVCAADGSDPVQMTSLESSSGSARWFPDGRRNVFDSSKEGHTEIYTIDITTLLPHRLTNESSDDVTPSVSPDGKWIYFASRRTGRFEVWRMPAEGGEAMQVTRNGGSWPLVSPDSKEVYYLGPDGVDVWKVAGGGGQETRVLGPVWEFAVAAEAIYFIETGTGFYKGSTGTSLKFFSFAKGTTKKVSYVKLQPSNGLSISPDGRYVLAALIDPFVCDLMLVENFR
jgi:Tol biopolymer transport system component/serine/threonine protein kinase